MTPADHPNSLSVEASIEAIQAVSMVPQILETVCKVTGMRFAAVARVTDERWTACAVRDTMGFGLGPGDDLVLGSTICDEIRGHGQPVIFGSASAHPVFSTHHTPRTYGLESYVSVPIFTAGHQFFGTLCAIDSEPRDFEEGTILGTLQLFANLIEAHLALHDRAESAETALKAEVDHGVLREQFLAVVGHDLRTPLQAAKLAAELLGPLQETDRGQRLVQTLTLSVNRMDGLIADIMDLTRGRLGGGIQLTLEERPDLGAVVEEAVEEVRQGQRRGEIVMEGTPEGVTRFDERRMRQLLANLLANAITHGDPEQPIRVSCVATEGALEVRVANQGQPIPSDILPRLFEPFVRPNSHAPRPGLGLGLFIASEIARAHAAVLTVSSSAETGTVFALRMPREG